MEQLLSVIVPVYNAEKYVEECIGSILAQTYRNLELILVDDGSKDTSGEICRHWAQKDARVKYVYQENAGVGAARNLGLSNASGEWIAFVDADDYIEPNFCTSMTDVLGVNGQVAFCAFRQVHGDRNEDSTEYTFETNVYPSRLFEFWKKKKKCSVWGAVYKKELLRGIEFSESLYVGEDTLFLSEVIVRSENLIYYDAPLYHYRVLENSAYHGSFDRKKKSEIDAWQRICEVFPKGSLGRLSAESVCAEMCLYMLRIYANDAKFDDTVAAELIRIYREKLLSLIRYDLLKHRGFFRHLAIGACPYEYVRRKGKKKQ